MRHCSFLTAAFAHAKSMSFPVVAMNFGTHLIVCVWTMGASLVAVDVPDTTTELGDCGARPSHGPSKSGGYGDRDGQKRRPENGQKKNTTFRKTNAGLCVKTDS